MKTCPQCKGAKKITVTSYENGKKSSFKMTCYTCDGAGVVTPKQEEIHQWIKNVWCKCKEPGESQYYNSPTGHGYTCSKCGKLLQVG